MNIKKYLPNILTTLRLLSVPIFIYLFINKYYLPGLVIFVCASITDFIDGFLARRWNVISKYGKIIDPIADKSLMISVLILLIIYINNLSISFGDVEIINDINLKNRPVVHFLNKDINDLIEKLDIQIDISISHINENATAVAIVKQNKE